MMGIK